MILICTLMNDDTGTDVTLYRGGQNSWPVDAAEEREESRRITRIKGAGPVIFYRGGEWLVVRECPHD